MRQSVRRLTLWAATVTPALLCCLELDNFYNYLYLWGGKH